MILRSLACVAAFLLVTGCSGGGGETSAGSGSTGAGTDEGSTSGAASASSTSAGTTSGSASGSSGSSSGGATTSGDPTATSGDPTAPGTTTGALTSGTDSEGTTTGGAVDLCAPAPQGDPCESDADCAIAGDCCSCVAYNPSMTSPGNCGGNCKTDRCTEWGLDAAICEQGVCVVKGKSCNADKVVCDQPAPECPMGSLPLIDDGCYSGGCLPVRACDWVPSCESCGPQAICNVTEGPGCAHHRCVPNLPECDGQPLCDCLGEIFCAPPHESCADEGGDLVCSIP